MDTFTGEGVVSSDDFTETMSEREGYFYVEDLFPGLFLPVLGRAGESLRSRCEWRRGVSKLLLAHPLHRPNATAAGI